MDTLPFPNRVTVELTSSCNLLCTFCHRYDMKLKQGNMTFDLYKKIIDEMAEHRPIALVPFFRGESLLHPEFLKFMCYAKSKGIGPIQLTSNGMLLTEELSCGIIEAGVDFVSFSLDTLDSKLYAKSRLHGDLKQSMQNVQRFKKLCTTYKSRGMAVPTVQVSTVDIEAYRSEQEAFIDYWRQHVDIVRVYEEHDDYGGFRNEAVREKLKFLDKRRPCRKINTDMIIYYDGRLALCNLDWDEQHPLGNVSQQSLQEAWNSKEYQRIRSMHRCDDITTDYICAHCEHWKADYLKQHFLGRIIK